MEPRRPQRPPPPRPIPHQRQHRQPAHQQNQRKGRPRPAVADAAGQLQAEEADHKSQAAGEVEERTALGRLRLVTVADVGVDTSGVYLDAETA